MPLRPFQPVPIWALPANPCRAVAAVEPEPANGVPGRQVRFAVSVEVTDAYDAVQAVPAAADLDPAQEAGAAVAPVEPQLSA